MIRGGAGRRFGTGRRPAGDPFRIGLFVPLCGAAGLWTPSSIACAQLALMEVNAGDGIDGCEVSFVLADAADESGDDVVATADRLIDNDEIDAIVGMHISAVRQRLARAVAGRVPYVYTPIYEGYEDTPGVFAIGETTRDELAPALRWISARHRARRWALVGNDYVWPRMGHRFAKEALIDLKAEIVLETFVPFGWDGYDALCERLAQSGAEAVLVSLIGQDAVEFHRAFGFQALDRRIVRLGHAFEENGLLATGGGNAKRLYVVSSYFGALDTHENRIFREKYHGLHGDRAPVLNALGQSLYEGVHFLEALMRRGGRDVGRLSRRRLAPLTYRSARRAQRPAGDIRPSPVYLARADGHLFNVIARLR